ncbi:MAG: hypothetical protein BMS9Abin13_480 [Patescibacteria group bacterium]|nr:MAG: hypothetical protein BMS9Abin13_480 [Patescibacteria group bacterium]
MKEGVGFERERGRESCSFPVKESRAKPVETGRRILQKFGASERSERAVSIPTSSAN